MGNAPPTNSRKSPDGAAGEDPERRAKGRTVAKGRNPRGSLLISRLKVRVLHWPWLGKRKRRPLGWRVGSVGNGMGTVGGASALSAPICLAGGRIETEHAPCVARQEELADLVIELERVEIS